MRITVITLYIVMITFSTDIDIIMVNDRRGHRKLRLTSRKYFSPKPKRSTKGLDDPLCLLLALPLTAYTNA